MFTSSIILLYSSTMDLILSTILSVFTLASISTGSESKSGSPLASVSTLPSASNLYPNVPFTPTESPSTVNELLSRISSTTSSEPLYLIATTASCPRTPPLTTASPLSIPNSLFKNALPSLSAPFAVPEILIEPLAPFSVDVNVNLSPTV